MAGGQTPFADRQTESEAIWFRQGKEAELAARMRIRELELRSFRDELAELRDMNTEQTVLRYWTATDDEIEQLKRSDQEYRQELEEIWIEGEANLKPQPDTREEEEQGE